MTIGTGCGFKTLCFNITISLYIFQLVWNEYLESGTDVIFDDSCNVPIVDDVMDIGRACLYPFTGFLRLEK